jgi:hypothetical protein
MSLNVKGYKNKGDIIYPAHPKAVSGEVTRRKMTPEELAEFNRRYPREVTKRPLGQNIVANMDKQVYEKYNKKIGAWW